MFAGDTLFYSHWIEIMPRICANITCVVGFVWICSFFCFGLFWCVFLCAEQVDIAWFFSEVHGDHRHAYSSGSLCPTLSGEGSVTLPERWFPGSCSKKILRMTCCVDRWDKRAPGSGDSMFSTPRLSEIASRFGTMKKLEVYHNSLLKSSSNKMTWDFYHSMIPTLQEFSPIDWSSLPESHEVFPTFFMAFTLKNSAARSDKARRNGVLWETYI